MKKFGLAIAVLAVTGTGALAQGVYIGDRGVGIDPGARFDRRGDYDRRDFDRRDRRDISETGSFRGGDCRTVTIRSEDDYGNTRVKRVRRCD